MFKKINNSRGFAISSLLYGMALVAILIVLFLVNTAYFTSVTTQEFVSDVEKNLNEYADSHFYGQSCPKKLYDVIRGSAQLDNIASEFVSNPAGIDFANVSSDTNGKGVYKLSSTQNDMYPIYYYRGEVGDNNVKFAGFCWKIIRTTETGGIKLIYNGIPDSNGYCANNTANLTQIGTSSFNLMANDNAYVGYMYGTAGSNSYAETHKNTNDSAIKKVIDDWYSKNMTEYTDKLEDTVWCNDRSVIKDATYKGDGSGQTMTSYGPRARYVSSVNPTLECKNPNDRFTVDSANGNGALTYPVALITIDEAIYAGIKQSVINNSYLTINEENDIWTMSPSGYTDSNNLAWELVVRSKYITSTSNKGVQEVRGVRPSISLKAGTMIIDGDGSSGKPYIIQE